MNLGVDGTIRLIVVHASSNKSIWMDASNAENDGQSTNKQNDKTTRVKCVGVLEILRAAWHIRAIQEKRSNIEALSKRENGTLPKISKNGGENIPKQKHQRHPTKRSYYKKPWSIETIFVYHKIGRDQLYSSLSFCPTQYMKKKQKKSNNSYKIYDISSIFLSMLV